MTDRVPTILLEVSPLAQGAQGISTYIRGLVDGLAALRARGEIAACFKLVYMNPHHEVPPPPGEGFENVVLKFPRRLAQALWARLPVLPLDAFVRGDLFHGCSHIVPHTRCPAWVTMHDVSWRAFPDSFGASQRSFNESFCGPSLRHCLASGGGVVSVSDFTASEVERHYGIPPQRQVVVHEAVEERARPVELARRTELRAWLGIPDDRPFLLCLGLLEKRKNIEGAIAAWEALRERGVDCALAVVGKDGEGADGIRRRAEASRWARDIALPGRAPAELLSALYAEAAAVLFLSWYEGFGLPVLEAMAAGTPVLVSDRASLPEVWGPAPVDSPRLVVDPQRPEAAADLLQPILLDPALRRRCIEHGVSRVRAFTWEKTARQTWAAWTSSLQRSGRVRAAESNPKATSP